ncbi:hypothetical protein K7711_09935 [Nocardia sp. CA2R105]|uniref:hypothetical protein n=1 Tax=Nocardia coffeae TaxID=2873381 RepID=UPI001CA6261C|nr:hypothetical protein [Nocardia coffeae]MBY8856795.1 hypothetical protein [Nocardia coffeae]
MTDTAIIPEKLGGRLDRHNVPGRGVVARHRAASDALGVKGGSADPKVLDAFGPMAMRSIATAAELARSLSAKTR